MTRSFDDPLRVVSWHPDLRILWCRSFDSFLDVYQAEILALVGWFADSHQYGKAQPTQRTASFPPVGRIQHFDRGFVLSRFQRGRQSPHVFLLKEPFDFEFLVLTQRPETLSQRNCRLGIFDA